MSEKEKQILEAITKAIPNMSEFNKGYLLGMGEAMASNKKPRALRGSCKADKRKYGYVSASELKQKGEKRKWRKQKQLQ